MTIRPGSPRFDRWITNEGLVIVGPLKPLDAIETTCTEKVGGAPADRRHPGRPAGAHTTAQEDRT